MHVNFGMWPKASWQLIQIEEKKEWDALDVVSKWLIATRSAVTLVTVYSCVIAGLLAWRDGNFSWIPFLILTLGLFIDTLLHVIPFTSALIARYWPPI